MVDGLLAPGERKSVQPLAARVAPGEHEQLRHCVATSHWPTEPLEWVLAQQAQHLVGGPGAVLMVDDTPLPKQGHCSVGVAHQYSGMLGKKANCQCLVSLTLARGEVQWRSPCGCSDPKLSARGLTWVVGIVRSQTVYPAAVSVLPRARAPLGRPPKYPLTSAGRLSTEQALAALPPGAWQPITWRRGTKGPLTAAFAAQRVRVAAGVPNAWGQHLPGDAVWLGGEHRSTGERKYYLSNLAVDTPLEELGLDHFEGRSWSGLHHHARLTMIALAFLQYLRLQRRAGAPLPTGGPPPQPTVPLLRRALFHLLTGDRCCPWCDGPLCPRAAAPKVAK